jgi:hypothetical protein
MSRLPPGESSAFRTKVVRDPALLRVARKSLRAG